MKNILKIFSLLCISFLIFSCSENNIDNNTTAMIENETNENNKKNITIGIGQFAEHSSLDNCRIGFIEGLKENGLVENENLTIFYDNAQTDGATSTQIFRNFLAKKVEMLVAIATPMAQSAYSVAMNTDIPIVYTAITDPVSANLANSDGMPVGNITGTSDKLPIEAQLKLIRNIIPNAKKIGILYTTSEVNSISSIDTYKQYAAQYGFEIIDNGISVSSDLPLAIDKILTEVDVISNVTDNTVVSSLPLLIQKAKEKNIPVFGSEIEQVKKGCIATVGIDYIALGKQTANIAYKILQGEKANEIPFETITEAATYLNTKVASDYGIVLNNELIENAAEIFDNIE